MKILLPIFLIFNLSFAQEKYKRYFVLDFQQSVDTQSKLERYYIVKSNEISFKDIKDSTINCQGSVYGSKNLDQIDKFIYYFKNYRGDINPELFFEKISAEFVVFDKNGQKDKKIYVKNNKYKVSQAWAENGDVMLISGTGIQTQNREDEEKHINQYKDSLLINSYTIRPLKNDTIYALFDKIAEPKGGIEEFYKRIQTKLKLPSKFNGKTHVAKIKFIVNKNGELEDIKSMRAKYDEIDDYIIKFMKTVPKWNPALFDGRPVKSKFTLPLKFNL